HEVGIGVQDEVAAPLELPNLVRTEADVFRRPVRVVKEGGLVLEVGTLEEMPGDEEPPLKDVVGVDVWRLPLHVDGAGRNDLDLIDEIDADIADEGQLAVANDIGCEDEVVGGEGRAVVPAD